MFFDLSKEYQTKDKHQVKIYSVRIGDAFPIKGTIHSPELKYSGYRSMRWTLDGFADVPKKPNFDQWDLVEKEFCLQGIGI